MNQVKFRNIAFVYAGLLILAAYFFGLFVDLTGDASKYAAIARHIVDSGDLINLKIHGEAYEQKPPLLFWLSALGLKIGGIHNWSFKIFPVLYSVAGLWFTFKLGETLYNKRTGQLAVLMLGTSWIYFLFISDIHTDLILQANTTLAIWQLAAYLKTQKPKHFFWAFVGVGLGMLSKGPVGAAVPALALVTHLVLTKDFKQLFHPKWALGIVIALLICLPAFLGLYNQFGAEGLKFFFITNNIGRITGSYNGSNTDYFYYLHTLSYLLLPWTFLLIFSFGYEIQSYFKKSGKREYLTVGAIWGFLLIASIAKGKAPHYIFTLVPLIMIITAHWVNAKMEEPGQKKVQLLTRFQVLIPVLIFVFILFIITYLFPAKNLLAWLIPIISIVFSMVLLIKEKLLMYRLFLPSSIMMSTLIIGMNAYVMPAIAGYQASIRASNIYNRNSSENDRMYNYLFAYYEVFFYSRSGATQLYSVKDFSPDSKNMSWIFTNEIGKDTICNLYQGLVDEIDTLPHYGMSTIRPRFINPKTREASLEPMYLVRIKPEKKSP